MVESSQLLMAGGAIAIVIVAGLINRSMSQKQPLGQAADGDDGHSVSPLLCKFARHDGAVVGETVAISGEQLILKDHGVFKAVPLAAATIDDDEVVLAGDIDWDAAKESGDAWRDANTKGIDPEVSAHLTRSEDVVAPALKATRDDDEDASAGDEEE